MKLWQKKYNTAEKVEKFTVGKDRELDILLAPYDVLGNMAHAAMLQHIGLLTEEELQGLHAELRNIYNGIEKGSFSIEKGVEDIHSQVEFILTARLGDTGKKIHTGRSRNDQVLLDLKLFTRAEIKNTVELVQQLFDKLIGLSEQYKNYLLPGYTHLQIAMPSSFGLWFAAYAESLVDDMYVLQGAYKVVNRNPLGSAAGYGASFPLNRQMTTDLLGFDSLDYNVVYAQMSRGKTERVVASALSSIAATLGRMAMDVCMYMSQNFGFISFPDELTTGSSIMPHKKNPDVFELIRARCNKLQALPNELAMICTNLPSGYHRDMQLIKETFLPAFAELNSCLDMADFMLEHIIVKDNLLDDNKYKYLFTVEAVNELVQQGMSFRDAYRTIGEQLAEGTFKKPDVSPVHSHTHEGSIGNLCNDKIKELMSAAVANFEFGKVDEALERLLDGKLAHKSPKGDLKTVMAPGSAS
jgi:argininosuccinate lyase